MRPALESEARRPMVGQMRYLVMRRRSLARRAAGANRESSSRIAAQVRRAGRTIRAREADHPDPVPERGGDPPGHARRAAPRGRGLRRRRVAGRRRRLDRPHGRGRAGARGRPHRPADQQQGAGRGLPGRARRLAEAGRRRDRQHRRRQPVLRRATSRAWSSRSSPAAPTWWSATGRCRRSSTSRRPRSCCSGSGAGSCAAPPGPACPTRPRASAPTTARRRCSCWSSTTTPTRSRA